MKRSTRNLSLLLIITAAAAWFYQDTLVGFWHQTRGIPAAQAPTDGAVNKGGDARKDGKGGKGEGRGAPSGTGVAQGKGAYVETRDCLICCVKG